jgi:shikimate dehydrogenase
MDHLRLGAAAWTDWKTIDFLLPATDVLVNCTSIGAAAQIGQSPLSLEQVSKLPAHAVVFDIIYQPSPSALLQLAHQRSLRTFDGAAMNLEQAVLAFGYAVPGGVDISMARSAMEIAKRTLN